MANSKVSGFSSFAAVLTPTNTAIAQLAIIAGADKVGRHDALIAQVGIICALTLAKEPAKGYGNPADHTKVARVFADAKMQRYADACIGLTVALKNKGFRSIGEWDDALAEGCAMADAMLCDLRPKVYSKAEEAARKVKQAERKVQREQEAKVAELAAASELETLKESEYQRGFAAGVASVQVPVVTAEMVADLIKAGAISLETLRDCLTGSVPALTYVAA